MRALTPFLVLCASGTLAIFSSTISKSPVLPLFSQFLGADEAVVGLISGVSAFTGIVASIPAGLLSDRIGRRRMLIASGVVFASAPLAYLFITELWQLALVRFYHGLSTAIFIPVGMAMVTDLHQEARGERLGWFSTSTLAGRFMAPIAGGALIAAMADGSGAGFRAVYVACSIAGALALVMMLRLPAEQRAEHAHRSMKQVWGALAQILSSRAIVLTCLVEAGVLFAYGTFETFLPLHSRLSGHSAYITGILLSSQVITLAIAKPAMGRFSDRHGRPPQIAAGGLMCAICIAALPVSGAFVALLALSVLFGLGLSIVTSATSAYIGDLSTKSARGSAMGALGSIMDIGHMSGPVVAGAVASGLGIGYAFICAGIVMAALTALFMKGGWKPRAAT